MDNRTGTDYLVILYSKQAQDIDRIRERFAGEQGSFPERVAKAVGPNFIPYANAQYEQSEMRFAAQSLNSKAVFGLLLAIGPYTLFPVCEAMGDMVMKCFWTRRAELGIGLVIVVLGVLTLVFKSSQIRLGLGIGVFLNGVLALLIPATLIGVCEHAHASCRVLALPALSVLSSILILISVINGITLSKRGR
jgi:hypothetical protein